MVESHWGSSPGAHPSFDTQLDPIATMLPLIPAPPPPSPPAVCDGRLTYSLTAVLLLIWARVPLRGTWPHALGKPTGPHALAKPTRPQSVSMSVWRPHTRQKYHTVVHHFNGARGPLRGTGLHALSNNTRLQSASTSVWLPPPPKHNKRTLRVESLSSCSLQPSSQEAGHTTQGLHLKGLPTISLSFPQQSITLPQQNPCWHSLIRRPHLRGSSNGWR